MDELKNEQTAVNAGAPVDETAKDIAASLGKFKDVNALLAAYNSLQAEFTKRCQRIKELERSAAVDKDTPTEQSEKADNRNLSRTLSKAT